MTKNKEEQEIFLIYKAWEDRFENTCDEAFGYRIIGAVLNEQDAEELCKDSPIVTEEEYGWAAEEGKPIYHYRNIKLIEAL